MTPQKNNKNEAEQKAFEALRSQLAAEFRLNKKATHLCAEMTPRAWGQWRALDGFNDAPTTIDRVRLMDAFLKTKLDMRELPTGRIQPDLNRYRTHILQMAVLNLGDAKAMTRKTSLDVLTQEIESIVENVDLLRRYAEGIDSAFQQYETAQALEAATSKWRAPQISSAQIDEILKGIPKDDWGDWEKEADFPGEGTAAEKVAFIDGYLLKELARRDLPAPEGIRRVRISHEDCLPWLRRSVLSGLRRSSSGRSVRYDEDLDHSFRFPEDLDKAVEDIDMLRKHARGERASLDNYDTCRDLSMFTDQWRDHGIKPEKLESARKRFVKEYDGDGSARQVVAPFEVNKNKAAPETIEIYELIGFAAASRNGFGSERWCTARIENTFKNYKRLFTLIHQPSGERWQFHFESGQFTDQRDQRVEWRNLTKRFPGLAAQFKPTIEAELKAIPLKPKNKKQFRGDFPHDQAIGNLAAICATVPEWNSKDFYTLFIKADALILDGENFLRACAASEIWRKLITTTDIKNCLGRSGQIAEIAKICASTEGWDTKTYYDLFVAAGALKKDPEEFLQACAMSEKWRNCLSQDDRRRVAKNTPHPVAVAELYSKTPGWDDDELFDLLSTAASQKSSGPDFLSVCDKSEKWSKLITEKHLLQLMYGAAQTCQFSVLLEYLSIIKPNKLWSSWLESQQGLPKILAITFDSLEQRDNSTYARSQPGIESIHHGLQSLLKFFKSCTHRDSFKAAVPLEAVTKFFTAYVGNTHHRLPLRELFVEMAAEPTWFEALALPQGMPAAFEKILDAELKAKEILKTQEQASQIGGDGKDIVEFVEEQAWELVEVCQHNPQLYADVTEEQLFKFVNHKFGNYPFAYQIMDMVKGNTEREALLTKDGGLPSALRSMIDDILVQPIPDRKREEFTNLGGAFGEVIARLDENDTYATMAARPDLLPRLLNITNTAPAAHKFWAKQMKLLLKEFPNLEAKLKTKPPAAGGSIPQRPGRDTNDVTYNTCYL